MMSSVTWSKYWAKHLTHVIKYILKIENFDAITWWSNNAKFRNTFWIIKFLNRDNSLSVLERFQHNLLSWHVSSIKSKLWIILLWRKIFLNVLSHVFHSPYSTSKKVCTIRQYIYAVHRISIYNFRKNVQTFYLILFYLNFY